MAEYNRIVEGLEARASEVNDVLKYVILSTAGVIAWLIGPHQSSDSEFVTAAWILPLAICCLGFARHLGVRVQIHMLVKHLEKIEREFFPYPYTMWGYEGYRLSAFREMRTNNPLWWLTEVNVIYLIMIFGTSVLLFHQIIKRFYEFLLEWALTF